MKRRDFLKLAGATMPMIGWMGGKVLSSGNAVEPVLNALPKEYLDEEFMDTGAVLEQFANLHNVKAEHPFDVNDFFDVEWSKILEEHLRKDLVVARLDKALKPGDSVTVSYFDPKTRVKRLQDCDRMEMNGLVTTKRFDIEHLQCRFMIHDSEQLIVSALDVCTGWCEPCIKSLAKELNAQEAVYTSNFKEWLPPPECGIKGSFYDGGRIPVRVLASYSAEHAAMTVCFDIFVALVQLS